MTLVAWLMVSIAVATRSELASTSRMVVHPTDRQDALNDFLLSSKTEQRIARWKKPPPPQKKKTEQFSLGLWDLAWDWGRTS